MRTITAFVMMCVWLLYATASVLTFVYGFMTSSLGGILLGAVLAWAGVLVVYCMEPLR